MQAVVLSVMALGLVVMPVADGSAGCVGGEAAAVRRRVRLPPPPAEAGLL